MSFKKDFTKGVIYTGIAKYLSLLVSLVVAAVLARLLNPEDFGEIAIATVFIGFITLLTGSGLSPAIIQRKELSQIEIESLFSFTAYLALFSTITFFVCIPIISKIYNSPTLETICSLLLINIFFSILNIIPNALLFKEKRFRYIAKRTIIVQLSLGILSITGAVWGLGIYSLLINPIIGSILLFFISYNCYRINLKLKFDFFIIKSFLPYSSYQIGFNILNYSYRNIDKLLIGRYMGIFELGYYEKSYRLMMMPLDHFSTIINPVLHPLLSEHQDDRQFIFEKYKRLVNYLGYIGFIITGFCFVCAKDIILAFFGNQWIQSISIFKILSLSIGIQLIQSAVGAIFQATNNVKILFISGLFSFIITVGAILLGIILRNIQYLAGLLTISFIITFFLYHFVLINKIMKESLLDFLKSLFYPLLSGFIIAIILYGFNKENVVSNIYLNLFLSILLTFLSIIMLQKVKIIKGFPDLLKWITNKISYFKITH